MTDPAPVELEARVRATLAEHPAGGTLTSFTVLPGGHSGITCLAEVEHDGTRRRLVVKAAPPGRPAIGRHDVLRQARILVALARAGVPGLPEVLAQQPDGSPFFVMGWHAGECAEPVLGEAPGLASRVIELRARAAARALAGLHAVDPARLALADEPTLTPLAEFERWTATMAAVDPALSNGAAEIEQALRAAPPDPMPARVVHGDFRLGNLLCREDGTLTIIDWEIWSLGDPRVDLGWLLLFCDPDNFPGVSQAAPMPPEPQLVAEYEQAGAGPVLGLAWFEAAARYKMAAVMGHNLARHRAGRHHDPYQEGLVPTIRHMIESAASTLATS